MRTESCSNNSYNKKTPNVGMRTALEGFEHVILSHSKLTPFLVYLCAYYKDCY
jgi:hypothetical protein